METFSIIIKDIITGCKKISLKLFENMDKETALFIYNFLFQYKSVLNMNEEILEKVRKTIVDKYENIQIYVLNPSLNDLFNNNVYKLEVENQIYFVPLWHNELTFDAKNNGDIIVKCMPELPENVVIDEDNHLYVYLNILFNFSLFEQKCISFQLGEKVFEIPINKLQIKKSQVFILYKMGISKICENDICNIKDKGDIYVNITFIEFIENL